MFRQRLKGGHRVGANNNSAASLFQNVSSSPVVPEYADQTGFTVNNPTLEAWNWDTAVSESSHGNEETPQPNRDFHSSNSNRPTSNYGKLNEQEAQFQNGENAKAGLCDEWNWGNDNWDWGSNELHNSNTYRQPFQEHHPQFQSSYAHTNSPAPGNNYIDSEINDSSRNEPLPSAKKLFMKQNDPVAISQAEEFPIHLSNKDLDEETILAPTPLIANEITQSSFSSSSDNLNADKQNKDIFTSKPDNNTYNKKRKTSLEENTDLISLINNNLNLSGDNIQQNFIPQQTSFQQGGQSSFDNDVNYKKHNLEDKFDILSTSQSNITDNFKDSPIQGTYSDLDEKPIATSVSDINREDIYQENYFKSQQDINWESDWQNWEEENISNVHLDNYEKQQITEAENNNKKSQDYKVQSNLEFLNNELSLGNEEKLVLENEEDKLDCENDEDKFHYEEDEEDKHECENKENKLVCENVKDNLELSHRDAVVPTVASWDDGWGDGWEIKPQDSCTGMPSNVDNEVSTAFSHHSEEFQINYDTSNKLLSEIDKRTLSSNDLNEDSCLEVANIEVLDQELQGIFSAPSEASLVLSSDLNENPPNIDLLQNYTVKENFIPEPLFNSQNVLGSHYSNQNESPSKFLNDNFPINDAENRDKASSLENTSLLKCEDNIQNQNTINNFTTSELSSEPNKEENYFSGSPPPSSSSEMVVPNELQNNDPPHAMNHPQNSHSFSYQLFSNEPMISRPNLEGNTTSRQNENVPNSQYSSESSSKSEACSIPNSTNPTSGPSGYMPSLHARKGSPFQPPVSRKGTITSQQFNEFSNSNIQINNESSENQQENSQCFVGVEGNEVNTKTSILSNLHIPEHNVKLCIAAQPQPNMTHIKMAENVTLNKVPLPIYGITQGEIKVSQTKEISQFSSSMQPISVSANNTELDTIGHSITNMSLASSSNETIKRETDQDPPAFSRMVPGESTKGESTNLPFYQAPSVVPSMPSGRVVTGNANPQPLSSVRVKQEPSVIRAPPDGPDAVTTLNQNQGVIPPVRSETIGSEDHAIRSLPPDRRESKEDMRDREGDREFYHERYRERKRQEDEYYRDESPRGMRMRERDYDLHYEDRRHRHHEDDEEKRFPEGLRDRRRRGYQDELERYGDRDRDRDFRRDKRRHRNRDHHYDQEDEDPYFEGRPSDRSRPSSRSSSYGNVESENGQRSYYSHSDDYYEHCPKGRERDLREYPRYKKRETRERDPYALNPYPDHYGSREMYDPQSYYYYYQKYLEQHPYYREYYRQYYGRYGYGAPSGEPLVDDKASTRSGRSSVNDDMKKSSVSSLAPYDPYGAYYGLPPSSDMSSQFRQDFLDQSSVTFEASSIYPEQGSYSYKSLVSGDMSGVPSVTDEGESDTQHRLSPQLFTGPHLSASFTSGGKLLLVLPNDPKEGEKATVQVRNVQKMLAVDSEYAARINNFRTYPGPLTLKETHKDTVLRFCESKAQEALRSTTLFDKESVVLMWEYLSLLVKQNGNVCGADLANLLTKGRTINSLTSSSSETNFEDKLNDGEALEGSPTDEGIAIIGRLPPKPSDRENQIVLINKFTEYLCLGRKKEAVDYAIREGLWGYAMTLAAKMDSVTHARVMSAFIHSIPNTDVLQTLIQHLSGKKPEVTKYYSAEKWGDWRQHLAMIVSNPTGNVQRDRASMIALGDTLASKNRLHAAHICFLASEAEWGTFSNKDSKLVLIGSSPSQSFQLFASDEAIQCTEIFEFAKSLDVNSPLLCSFQSYKLIYGLRLAECGFPNESLKYCEVISESVKKKPSAFQMDFVAQVFELASQLKYYDVHYQMGQGEVTEMPDPEWLQNIQHILYTMQYQAEEILKSSSAQVEKEEISSRPSTAAGKSDLKRSSQTPDSMKYYLQEDSHQSSGHPSLQAQNYAPEVTTDADGGSYTSNNPVTYEEKPNTPEVLHNQRLHSTPINSSNVSHLSGTSMPVQQQPYIDPHNQSQYQHHMHQQQQLPSCEPSEQPSQHHLWQQSQYDQQTHYQAESNQEQKPQQSFYCAPNQPEPKLQTTPVLQPVEPKANQNYHWQEEQMSLNPTDINGREDVTQRHTNEQMYNNQEKSKEEEEYWAMVSGKDGMVKTSTKESDEYYLSKLAPGIPKSEVVYSLCEHCKCGFNLNNNGLKKQIPTSDTFNKNKTPIKDNEVRNLKGNYKRKFSSKGSDDCFSLPKAPLTILQSVEEDFEKGVIKTSLVFGGSFPIDAPISARPLGSQSTDKYLKTFQVDAICCAPPYLCKDHRISQNSRIVMPSQTDSSPSLLDSNLNTPSNVPFYEAPKLENLENIEETMLYPVDESFSCYSYSLDEDVGDGLDFDYEYDYETENNVDNTDLDRQTEEFCEKEVSKNSSRHIHIPLPAYILKQTSCIPHIDCKTPKIWGEEFISRDQYRSNDEFCPQLQAAKENEIGNVGVQNSETSEKTKVSPEQTQIRNETKENPPTDFVDGSPPKEEEVKKHGEDKDDKTDDKKSQGFLGSLFGGWRKGNNQAKLPDDKNPAIVWDENKKKWVNKDGDDENDAPPPPPPSSLAGIPPPNLRGGIRKSRYVDPIGEKGRTKSSVAALPPPLPTPLTPFSNSSNSELPSEASRETTQMAPEIPHQPRENEDMIKRQRYASECSSVDIDDDFGPGLNQNLVTPDAIPMMTQADSQPQPMFFNPAQFQQPGSNTSNQPRRAGPARRSFNPQR